MAAKDKGQEVVVETFEEPVVAEAAPAPVESVYTAADLVKNHKAFHTTRDIVVVALRLAGKTTATFNEAKSIIDNFRFKEVK